VGKAAPGSGRRVFAARNRKQEIKEKIKELQSGLARQAPRGKKRRR
jgi:hypothetical protein